MITNSAVFTLRRALSTGSLALLMLLAGSAIQAKDDDDKPTVPGKYEDWGDIINSLEIKERFKLGDYAKVIVIPVETSKTPLPDKDDNTHEPTVNVLKKATPILIEGMRNELNSPPIAAGDAPPPAAAPAAATPPAAAPDSAAASIAPPSAAAGTAAPKSLVVRLRIVGLNPGSRAARHWVGFGAGKSSVELEGDVRDSASGKVLLSFSVTRSSSGAWKMSGGNYEKMMTGDIEDTGSDVGTLLAAFK